MAYLVRDIPKNWGGIMLNSSTDGEQKAFIKNGKEKKFNNFKRRLSAFFHFTSKSDDYGDNWRSKKRYVPAMITLTYPDNKAWDPQHISLFMTHLRNYASRHMSIKRLRYAWVAETTKNGVIHYHIVVWLPRKKRFPKPDDQGWWKHGLSTIEFVKKGVYNYLLKYISKGVEIPFTSSLLRLTPKGRRMSPRMFGYGGLEPNSRELLTHQMLPYYIKDAAGYVPSGQSLHRVKGGWQIGTKPYVSYFRGDFNGNNLEYKAYFNPSFLSNFEIIKDQENHITYTQYGNKWSKIEHTFDDIFIPF